MQHTIFGEVAEGLDVLEAINEAPCDDAGRPLQVRFHQAGTSAWPCQPCPLAASGPACPPASPCAPPHPCHPHACRTFAFGTRLCWTTPPPTPEAWRRTSPTPRLRRRCAVAASARPLAGRTLRDTAPACTPLSCERAAPPALSPLQFADDGRLEDDWVPDEETRDPEEIERANRCAWAVLSAPGWGAWAQMWAVQGRP